VAPAADDAAAALAAVAAYAFEELVAVAVVAAFDESAACSAASHLAVMHLTSPCLKKEFLASSGMLTPLQQTGIQS